MVIENILRGNDDLYNTLYDRIINEIKYLEKSYEWVWNKDKKCFINNDTRDEEIADTIYYDCDECLIHPKILQTYMEEYLITKEIKQYLKTVSGIDSVKEYCYQYINEKHIYKIQRTKGYRINFRNINEKIKETYDKEIEIIEYNHDEEGDFIVIKLLL